MTIVHTDKAPAAVGPYSQALKSGGLVWCSGQIAIDPEKGAIVAETAEDQTRQAIRNLGEVLKAAGSSLSKVLKTTVFISNMNDFAIVNKVYEEEFGDAKPARSCVEVSRLPKGALVELDAVAEA